VTRVAVVTTSYPRDEDDPSGHFVRAEVRALERAGVEVEVFAPGGPAFGWPGVIARVRERWWRSAAVVPAVATWQARYAMRARRFDKTIAHWVVPSGLPIALSGAYQELELVSHGADVRLLVGAPRLLRERAVNILTRAATTWRFPSDALLEALDASLARPLRARVSRVARVVAPALDLPASVPPIARPEGRTLVTVARLVASKRVDAAIAHAAAVRAALVVVGDGPERARLEAMARDLGVKARFTGTLPRPEALGWIAVADALIHASAAEGLSCVVREAEALGTTVVRL
jgi:teichuronic acid biosynthesis glycosyltransferase TuaC